MENLNESRRRQRGVKKMSSRQRSLLQAVTILLWSNPLHSNPSHVHAFHSLSLLPVHTHVRPRVRRYASSIMTAPALHSSPDPLDRDTKHDTKHDNSSSNHNHHARHARRRSKHKATPERREWLLQATQNLLDSPPGSLTNGKWHELSSILKAWSTFSKTDAQAPVHMEALLKRLWTEYRAGNAQASPTIELYNYVLDAWACAALFKTHGFSASQRAREILVLLQEMYEETGNEQLKPVAASFDVVLHVVCRTEGALIARRLLAWMEYLCKSGKNASAKPGRHEYLLVLDAYANSRDENAGQLAEGFLRHMQCGDVQPDTYAYNIAIRSWQRAKRGRAAAEHCDRILEVMPVQKDLITYASVISAWATSGMRAHAVSRAEELLREIESSELEPNVVVLNAVMSAWVKSRNPAAMDRTAEILRQMQGSGGRVSADLISYNTHLHALSMHGNKAGVAQRAEDFLLDMEERYKAGELAFAPNLFTFNLVIDAWGRSSDPNAATRAAEILRKLVKCDGVDPDTFSFNQVLAALSKSSVKGGPRMAQELLVYMEDAYETGVHPNAKPDIVSYTSVIVAHSRGGEQGAAERAERLLDHVKERYASMGEDDLKPNRACYNSLIDCWARSGEGTLGARKAEALLHEMQSMYAGGDEYMAPNIVTYNALLNAWARSGTRCCGSKAEYYLERMWELFRAGDKKVKPNDLSYNTVINAISKSQNEGKAQKALRILRRMDKLYQAGNKEARPNEITYTAVLNSCAFPAALDPRTRRKALDTAIFTLEELQASRYGQPNQVTYGTFLKACANLLQDDEATRREVIERAFQQCCKDGQVGEMVLAYLRQAAPAGLYRELLAGLFRPGASISVDDLPQEWRCNVRHKERWRNRPFSKKSNAPRQHQRSPRQGRNTRRLEP